MIGSVEHGHSGRLSRVGGRTVAVGITGQQVVGGGVPAQTTVQIAQWNVVHLVVLVQVVMVVVVAALLVLVTVHVYQRPV